ncbi:MAG: hypothetical protein Kow00114_40520 [Kiloniellaceae bacterium]
MPTKKSATKSTAKKPAAAAPAPAAAAAPTAAAAVEPVETAFAANQETIETVLKAGTQAATKGYEQAIALAQEQVEKASETIFKRYDEIAGLGKDNVDAYVRSTTALTKGFESLNKELMSIAQSTVEANVATAKAIFGVTTLRELIDLQTEFSRSRFDSAVAESAKLTEMTMALANDAFEPIQLSMNATVEKFMKPIAA